MTTALIIAVLILVTMFVYASLQLQEWHWCPSCRNFWSDEGDTSITEPFSARQPVRPCVCASCEIIKNHKP